MHVDVPSQRNVKLQATTVEAHTMEIHKFYIGQMQVLKSHLLCQRIVMILMYHHSLIHHQNQHTRLVKVIFLFLTFNFPNSDINW
jgi:hypothetical protein